VTQSRTISQTLQTINNNNNNNFSTTTNSVRNKIHMNVDQSSPQINGSTSSNHKEIAKHPDQLSEPNNNTSTPNDINSTSSPSSSKSNCIRNHPVSRKGAEFHSQQATGFRSTGGQNKYITQKNR
jgi:hypothetical protein